MLSLSVAIAQSKKYFNPLGQEAIQGRLAILDEAKNFGRLPLESKNVVRDPVWSLGTNSAGLYIEFETSSDSIQVRYKVKGSLNMPHMPSTGVSGVDLYSFNKTTKSWDWAFGQYQFKDTVTYNFNNIGKNINHTYRLYLPLYNTVEWLEIGVNVNENFKFIRKDNKPIIVYGTSIAQGACASRPGVGWTNILGREFDNEVVNLAFSGNGRLEQPILDLINKEDAAVYILDCIPNLAITNSRSEGQLDSLITHAVQLLRSKHPTTPIVLAEHSSAYTRGFQNIHTMAEYGKSSKVVHATVKRLKKSGVKKLYFVSAMDYNLDINSTVDYAHPNDIGMLKIAEAYHKILKRIL
ncbi:SGNH/GDSL hydrolase family protein [Sphingobacterium bovistauri]|uniref:SGNH/GDSL hydrolase family protein n=1 Tax=Sphingobacterium bovistauri TaxID=2781959 RepID=A0ABS7Z6Z0_9SPHI|nr:SGNH/GDSL hydrolase family protein [Sphingobacterium bovistauri]MCA5005929.1 SGNH/GDSL hydrolase family protein [Sphingobacterium bovistauri]